MSIGETITRFDNVIPRRENGVNIGGGGVSTVLLPGRVHFESAAPTEFLLSSVLSVLFVVASAWNAVDARLENHRSIPDRYVESRSRRFSWLTLWLRVRRL